MTEHKAPKTKKKPIAEPKTMGEILDEALKRAGQQNQLPQTEKKVKSFYCIRRAGTFTVYVTNQSDAQCGFKRHPLFFYELKVVFNGEAPLSPDGFIIAHEALDAFIQNTTLYGTCETMQQTFKESFESFLQDFSISDQETDVYDEFDGDDKSDILFTHTAGYRLRIRPTPDSIAYIDASVLYDADCSYLLTGV